MKEIINLNALLNYKISLTFFFVKTEIRLQSGLDCSMPGYYRDAQNCKKFYYCPYPATEGLSYLSDEDKQALHEFTIRGLECPELSFFDESVSQCETFTMANYIPVECKESHSGVRQPFTYNEGVKTGVVQEMSSNDH